MNGPESSRRSHLFSPDHSPHGVADDVLSRDQALRLLFETVSVDPLKDTDFVQRYPNLLDGGEASPSVVIGERKRLRRFYRRLAMLRRDICRLQKDPALQVAALKEESLRLLFEYYRKTYRLDSTQFDEERRRFIWAIKEARASIQRLMDAYIPEVDRLQVDMSSDVESEDDPIELIRLCGLGGEDVLSRRTRAEARRQLTIAMLLFEMLRFGSSPDDLDRDLADFDDEMKQEFFIRRKSTRLLIAADLDPQNAYRVSKFAFEPYGTSDEHRVSSDDRIYGKIDARYIRTDGREIPVIYEARVKRDPWIKLIQKNERDSRSLLDLCGARFVFFSERDLMAGVDLLRSHVVYVPGTVFGQESNLVRAGVVDVRNSSSAEEYRAWKFNVMLFGRFFELQLMLLPDWLNERWSRGPENHVHYKLRRNLSRVFPKLFPNVDWNDPGLRMRMHAMQLGKIGHSSGQLA